jgi:hypothetical protein
MVVTVTYLGAKGKSKEVDPVTKDKRHGRILPDFSKKSWVQGIASLKFPRFSALSSNKSSRHAHLLAGVWPKKMHSAVPVCQWPTSPMSTISLAVSSRAREVGMSK